MHYHCDTYSLLSFKKMDKLVTMINQGINKVIADDFARDRGQRLSPVQNSGEDNIQDTTARLQLVYQQVGTD